MTRHDAHGAAHVAAGSVTTHNVHGALVRPLLYLGVERLVIALETTLCLALILGVGPALATFAIVGIIVAVVHPVMAWLTAKDPLTTEVYLRSRSYADFYAPHASLDGSTPRPRPSIPRAH